VDDKRPPADNKQQVEERGALLIIDGRTIAAFIVHACCCKQARELLFDVRFCPHTHHTCAQKQQPGAFKREQAAAARRAR
jgi:hypothetical protein